MALQQPIKPIKPGSIVDRRGGRPKYLLKSGNLSSRSTRKTAMTEHYEQRAEQRKQCKP